MSRGRRRPLLVGVAAYALASLLCALAPSMPILVVCRLIQGVGGAVGVVIASAVVRDVYAARHCSLTPRGLSSADYRRLYGVLDDARRFGEHRLTYARGNSEHTDDINVVYLASLAAAGARGGCLWWRGEWACTRTYRVRDRRGANFLPRAAWL